MNIAAREMLHARMDALQVELTICRSPRQLRMLEGALAATRVWLLRLEQ